MNERPCCTEPAPSPRENPPGANTIRYRTSTWASARARMIAGLTTAAVPPETADPTRPLAALSTRESFDPTLALIDGWACVCDVLSFYGERIVNEGYLDTAMERSSVVSIARMLGYEPSPGVAASTTLAFTIDAKSTSGEPVALAAGLAVMSVPGTGEMPQTFETTESIEARSGWNTLVPRQTKDVGVPYGSTEILLSGVSTRLEVGSPLVFTGASGSTLRYVADIEVLPATGTTRVRLSEALNQALTSGTEILTFRDRAALFGWNAPDYRVLSAELKAAFDSDPIGNLLNLQLLTLTEGNTSLSIVRSLVSDWPDLTATGKTFDLDREYPKLLNGSQVLILQGADASLRSVTSTSIASRTDFTLTAKCTRMVLESSTSLSLKPRSTTIYIQSERLYLAEPPDLSAVSGNAVVLDGVYEEMPRGRPIIASGLDAAGEPYAGVFTVAGWSKVGSRSAVTLDGALPALARGSVVIYGNAARATHGATVANEVLGSGNATVAHARYALLQPPLTWVSAANPSGRAPALEVRVDRVLWSYAETLHQAGPSDRAYTLETSESGATAVRFGDGIHGARVPTGARNVTATYRKGLGLAGAVAAGKLSLPQTRPLGLTGVTNPAAAAGAADPESLDDVRTNAPLTILTLDRLVALQDYEDFARAFAGIGKARVTDLRSGKRSVVHLTVADARGEPLPAGSQTRLALAAAIEAQRDVAHVVYVDTYDEATFGVKIRVVRDPAHTAEAVEAAVKSALTQAFSWTNRSFGQPVAASEATTVAQGVAGVIAVDIDELFRDDTGPARVLLARSARYNGSSVERAELLLLDPDQITLTWMDL